MRTKTCFSNSVLCGSSNDTDLQFCVPQASITGGSSCPPNNLEVIYSNENSKVAEFTKVGRNIAYRLDGKDNFKNPISDIIYAISPPCNNLEHDYVVRPIPINPQVRDR
jgi:hypothetical protein